METPTRYSIDPIARIEAYYRQQWGQAFFELAYLGGRGYVPTVHDGRGNHVILRRTRKGYVPCLNS